MSVTLAAYDEDGLFGFAEDGEWATATSRSSASRSPWASVEEFLTTLPPSTWRAYSTNTILGLLTRFAIRARCS